MNTYSKQLLTLRANLAAKAAKLRRDPRTRNFLGFAMVAMLCVVAFTLAQPTAERTGTLNAPADMPLIMDGKKVGSTTLPAGAKVKVLREEAGKTLVETAAGQTWVENGTVAAEETQAPAAPAPTSTPPPDPAATIVQEPSAAPSASPMPNMGAKGKKALIFLWNGTNQITRRLIQLLEEQGVEVKTVGAIATIYTPEQQVDVAPPQTSYWEKVPGAQASPADYSVEIQGTGRKMSPKSAPWSDDLIKTTDIFIFADIDSRFEPGSKLDLKKIINSEKIVICGESIPATLQARLSDRDWSGGKNHNFKAFTLQTQKNLIFYQVFEHSWGKKVKPVTTEAAEQFVDEKLFPEVMKQLK